MMIMKMTMVMMIVIIFISIVHVSIICTCVVEFWYFADDADEKEEYCFQGVD